MVYYDSEFDAPTVPDGEDENDTTVDQNVLDGASTYLALACLLSRRARCLAYFLPRS